MLSRSKLCHAERQTSLQNCFFFLVVVPGFLQKRQLKSRGAFCILPFKRVGVGSGMGVRYHRLNGMATPQNRLTRKIPG